MTKFSTVCLYKTHAAMLGCKPLTSFFRTNLDRERQIWLRLGAMYITLDLVKISDAHQSQEN